MGIEVCTGCGTQEFPGQLTHYKGCEEPGTVAITDPHMPLQLSERALRNRIQAAKLAMDVAGYNRRSDSRQKVADLRRVYRERFGECLW